MTSPWSKREAVEFTLDPGALQSTVLRTGWLSFLTIGFYRFWMKTKIRQLIWRSVGVRGDRFEYTGTPIELLLGSMFAVVILATVLGVFNLAISFAGLAIWQEGMFNVATVLSLVFALPLIQYAIYRARRYRLLRTKFRGIRCGMDGSAWRFVGIWALWGVVTVLTLGLAYPWFRTARERYMTRHMLYGDARFSFEGSGRALAASYLPFWFAAAAPIAITALSAASYLSFGAYNLGAWALFFPVYAYFLFWLYCRYRAAELRHFIAARRVADVSFESRFETWGLLGPYWAIAGRSIIPGIPVVIVIAVIVSCALYLAQIVDGADPELIWSIDDVGFGDFDTIPAQAILFIAFWISYGLTILFYVWLWSVVYQRRYLTHLFATMTVTGMESLDHVRQRTADDQIESEGFADALDVGGL